jgi:hypothetical protein
LKSDAPPPPNAEDRVAAIAAYVKRLHDELLRLGHPTGLLGYQRQPFPDDALPDDDEGCPLAETALEAAHLAGIRPPAWYRL